MQILEDESVKASLYVQGVLAVLPDFLSLSSLAGSNVYFNTILHCLPTKGDISLYTVATRCCPLCE